MDSSRLMQLRENKGLTRAQVAIDMGVSPSTYGKWELAQRKPDTDTTIKMAEYFEVSTDYLLGISDNPSPIDTKKEAPSVESTEEALKIIAYNAFGPNPTQEQINSLDLAVRIAIEQARDKRK